MFHRNSTVNASKLVDQAASATSHGIAATQHALNSLTGGVQALRDEAGTRLDDATEHAQALVHRGVDALHDGSRRLRIKAHQASAGTTHYIRHEPVKAVLIAAATGAVVMALIVLMTRPRGHA
ncbi:MAG: hypothetical protein Q8M01_13930 [Rubrivivax sp.]|nr:hypothetical protein [Rubrivivax sp.]